MKNSLTNPVRYGKIIVVEAVLLTIGIHVLFFQLFSAPEVKQEQTVNEYTSVALLNFSSGGDAQELKKYIEKYSPAHFSGSRSPQGFGSFMPRKTAQKLILPDLSSKSPDISIPQKKENYRDLPDMTPSKLSLPLPETAKNTAPSSKKISYPFAVSDSGTVIPMTFSTEEQRIINEFPLTCGVYKLLKKPEHGLMPRLVLLQSCGRRTLDRLSINMLYQEIKKLSNCKDGEIFTVHYRDHDAGGDL